MPLFLPLIFLAVCTFLVTFPFFSSPGNTGIAIAITLVGIPVYGVTVYWQNKPKFYKKSIRKYKKLQI